MLERLFMQNLRSREISAQALGKKKPLYAGHLLDRDIHIAEFEIPVDSLWTGLTFKDLRLRTRFGVHVSSIFRGNRRINIPSGDYPLFDGDRLQVIGSDEQLAVFGEAVRSELYDTEPDPEAREMKLAQILINSKSPFLGKTLVDSGIRDIYGCMVVGLEEGEENLTECSPQHVFAEDEIVWIVGERDDIKAICSL